MRKIWVIAVFGLVALPLQVRAQQAPPTALAQAENAFSVDLYGKLSQTPGNLFFSPYSVATALDMVYVGAKGATADEIARTLHLNLLCAKGKGPDFQAALLNDAKTQQLFPYSQPDGFKFEAANALWGDKSSSFNPNFISIVQASFGGDLESVNFKHPERASARINNWVAKQTQGKTQNLISPDMLLDDPAMMLTNAVYFKAAWADNFNPYATKPAKFHVSEGRGVMTDMMNKRGWFTLMQADGVKVLSIPYRNDDASMVIILPDVSQGLSVLEAKLSAEKLNTWLTNSRTVPVILSIPKFQIDSEFQLKNDLMLLGMSTGFDANKADFTGIASDPHRPIYIGAIVHKAYIGIDEKGTEATAATTALVSLSGGIEAPQPPPPPPVRFIADHPFIYLIRSNGNGEILFMGRVADPTQHGD
jgi:serpin B